MKDLFKRISKSFKLISKSFERISKSSERKSKSFERTSYMCQHRYGAIKTPHPPRKAIKSPSPTIVKSQYKTTCINNIQLDTTSTTALWRKAVKRSNHNLMQKVLGLFTQSVICLLCKNKTFGKILFLRSSN